MHTLHVAVVMVTKSINGNVRIKYWKAVGILMCICPNLFRL